MAKSSLLDGYKKRLTPEELKRSIYLYNKLDWHITAIATRFNISETQLRKQMAKEGGIVFRNKKVWNYE